MSTTLNFDYIKKYQDELNEILFKHLNKSLLYADQQFTEWFHLTCGLDYLVKTCGVLNIKDFEPSQNGDVDNLKAVFFISKPLDDGCVLEILRNILIKSKFQYVILVSNVLMGNVDKNDDFIDALKDDLLMWMGNANYVCDVIFEKFPFLCIPTQNPVTSKTTSSIQFFLNPLSSWSSDLDYQLINSSSYEYLIKQEINELSSSALTSSTSSSSTSQSSNTLANSYQYLKKSEIDEIQALCCSFNQMLEYLDAKDDCFSLGILSKIVAQELNSMNKTKLRRKNAPNKVSLLLIDRNLDLSNVSLYHDETHFDKMTNLLENLTQISNDVKIDLSEVLFDNKFKCTPYGCFFHSTNIVCQQLIEQILVTKPKECLLEIYRKLNEAFTDDTKQQTPNRLQRITVDTIRTRIKSQIKKNPKCLLDHSDFIQIIAAYCMSYDTQTQNEVRYDKLISYIQVLTQNLLDRDGPSVLSQIYGIFQDDFENIDETNRLYSVLDLLTVVIYIYSLIGEDCFYGIEEENRIKRLIINELQNSLKRDDRNSFQNDINFFLSCSQSTTATHEEIIDEFFKKLKNFKQYRSNFKQFNQLLDKQSVLYKPLIKQVCELLIRTHQLQSQSQQQQQSINDQLIDIEYRTTASSTTEGLKEMFKQFKFGSYLVNTTKTHPLNNEILIIYFIGGITSYEMKLVKEIFSKTNYKLLVGSSHFYSHKKLIKYLSK